MKTPATRTELNRTVEQAIADMQAQPVSEKPVRERTMQLMPRKDHRRRLKLGVGIEGSRGYGFTRIWAAAYAPGKGQSKQIAWASVVNFDDVRLDMGMTCACLWLGSAAFDIHHDEVCQVQQFFFPGPPNPFISGLNSP